MPKLSSARFTKPALALVTLVLAGGAAWGFWRGWEAGRTGGPPPLAENGSNRPAVNPAVLAAQYEAGVRELWPDYRQALQAGEAAAIDAVRDRLLALTVPKNERETHIALVLLLERRLDGSVTAEEAPGRAGALAAEVPWLP